MKRITYRITPTILLLVMAAGCSKPAPGSGATDPLAGAPADFAEFLAWAEQRLQAQPEPIPLPNSPTLPEPKWDFLRLDDRSRFALANKSSKWSHSTEQPKILAEVRDLRSDQRSPNCASRVKPKATPDGKAAIELTIGGFQVRREEVGRIELDATIPFGRHFTLVWSKAGQILVPAAPGGERFTYRINTDGLAEWRGTLKNIQLLTDGSGEGAIQIHALRFKPQSEAYPKAIGLKRVQLGEELRDAVYSHCPAQITYKAIKIPADGKLHVGLGAVSQSTRTQDVAATAGVRFEISVTDASGTTSVFAQMLMPREAWTDAEVSLARWSGQQVSLTLSTTSKAPGAVALWANPIVYQPLDNPPIVVIYLIDTVASEHVQLYGYNRTTMPRLAALAERGAWFADMVSNSSRTIESIPDLMLSMPTERHGVHHNWTPVPRGLVTLPEVLRAAGFATVSYCTNVNAGPRQAMDQGFDTFFDKIGYWWTETDRTVPLKQVASWIDTHSDRPMFLYIHTAEPHSPYTPPEGYAGRFDPQYKGRVDGTRGENGYIRRIRNPRNQRRDLQHVSALYDEEILYADTRMGRFLDLLKERAMLERTDILVTSDHGEEFLQHGRWEHGTNLHNEQTRVPLVVAGPSITARGRLDAPAQLMDLMPTILDMHDLPQPYALDGRSLFATLRGSKQPNSKKTIRFGSNHNFRASASLVEHYAIDGNWKLVFAAAQLPGGPADAKTHFALFDLSSDPRERTNLLAKNEQVSRRLIAELLRWKASHSPYISDADNVEHTQGDAGNLEALGYLGGDTATEAADEDREPEAP